MTGRHILFAVVASVAVALGSPAWAVDEFDAETGYRINNYSQPIASAPEGATALTTEEVVAMMADGNAVLVDVTPVERTSETAFSGAWEPKETRMNLPGSVWLPNVGYGVLEDEMSSYFAEQLEAATGGATDVPVIVYCFRDCWMSWNGAKRAMEMGYTNVYWYGEGSTGFEEASLEMAEGEPVPLKVE